MFRRRDEDGNFEEGQNSGQSAGKTTTFGGFEVESPNAARQKRDAEMNEEAVDTLSSQRTSSLFKTVNTETTNTSSFANVTPKAPSRSAAPAAPKPTTGSPSSRFEGVEAERRLTVGYGITLNGKISDCDKLIIYGTVDAELDNVTTLHISESGTFKGSANIQQAEISGTFEGDINVTENIVINSTGRVNGKITYGSIEIKPGGKFTGQIVEAADLEAVKPAKAAKKTKKAQAQTEEFQLAPEPLENEEIVA